MFLNDVGLIFRHLQAQVQKNFCPYMALRRAHISQMLLSADKCTVRNFACTNAAERLSWGHGLPMVLVLLCQLLAMALT